MNARDERWLEWISGVRSTLTTMPNPHDGVSQEAGAFFKWAYSSHAPERVTPPSSPAMRWTPQNLLNIAGSVEVEVQGERLSDPKYELHSPSLKRRMKFSDFIVDIHNRPGNDIYMTANNAATNSELVGRLAEDLLPLPPMLVPTPNAGFIWIGKDTITPIHHDLTQNLLIVHYGIKHVTLFPPRDQPKLLNRVHVFSEYQFLEPNQSSALGLSPREYVLFPGDALFIPVGWWHQVRSSGVCIMSSWTSFLWPNNWSSGFPS